MSVIEKKLINYRTFYRTRNTSKGKKGLLVWDTCGPKERTYLASKSLLYFLTAFNVLGAADYFL